MDYRLERVTIEDIDEENQAFRITTHRDKAPLDKSIGRVGLITPITIKQAAPAPMVVVSGFRRLQACRQLGWETLPCRILPPRTSTAHCAEIAIADNLTQRSFNLIEQARCLQLLAHEEIEPSTARGISEMLGIAMNRGLKLKLLRVLRAPQSVQNALIQGTVNLPTALQVAELTQTDANRIIALFEHLPMGLNRQRETLLLLKEIAMREDVPLQQVLDENGLQHILKDEGLDGNQRIRRMRDYLRKRRYPRLTAVENGFGQCVRELKLDNSMQISPPPGFEGRTCTMTIRFANQNDLRKATRRISEVAEHTALAKLFELI